MIDEILKKELTRLGGELFNTVVEIAFINLFLGKHYADNKDFKRAKERLILSQLFFSEIRKKDWESYVKHIIKQIDDNNYIHEELITDEDGKIQSRETL